MNIKKRIKEYNEKIYPDVLKHNDRLRNLLVSDSTDEYKATVLLIGDDDWYTGCHQWYLKLYKDIYNQVIADIVNHRLWDMPLDKFSSFEELYESIGHWLQRRYVNQLTIYDVALRLVLARKEERLKPKEFVYIHAKPRKLYRDLYKSKLVSYKPNGWNIKVPIKEFRKNFSNLIVFESYLIEDLLCYIAKEEL